MEFEIRKRHSLVDPTMMYGNWTHKITQLFYTV